MPFTLRVETVTVPPNVPAGSPWSVGAAPDALGNMWVTSFASGKLFKYAISGRVLLNTFPNAYSGGPQQCCFDGAGNLWTCDSKAGDFNNLVVTTNGVVVNTFSPALPSVDVVIWIVFDGTGNMFTLSQRVGSNHSILYKVRVSDGSVLASFDLGAVNPLGSTPNLTFEPITNSVWFTDFTGKLYQVAVSTCTLTNSFAAGTYTPNQIGPMIFALGSLWFADNTSQTIFQIAPQTGGLQNSVAMPGVASSMATDGTNIWSILVNGSTVSAFILQNGNIKKKSNLVIDNSGFGGTYLVWDGVSSMWLTQIGIGAPGELRVLTAFPGSSGPAIILPTPPILITLPFCSFCPWLY